MVGEPPHEGYGTGASAREDSVSVTSLQDEKEVPAPSAKSVQRKVNKLLLYGRTHENPRRRRRAKKKKKPHAENGSNAPGLSSPDSLQSSKTDTSSVCSRGTKGSFHASNGGKNITHGNGLPKAKGRRRRQKNYQSRGKPDESFQSHHDPLKYNRAGLALEALQTSPFDKRWSPRNESQHFVYNEPSSRLPLVNAENTASFAAFSVLETQVSPRSRGFNSGIVGNLPTITHQNGSLGGIPYNDLVAFDPVAMEMLVQDIAKALPDPELIEISQSENGESVLSLSPKSADGSKSKRRYRRLSNNFVLDDSNFASRNQHQPEQHRPSNLGRKQGKSNDAVASKPDTLTDTDSVLKSPLLYGYDPHRDARVALVVQMAEEERRRRINENMENQLQEKLERARRIEWAVKAIEEERKRQLRRSTDYENQQSAQDQKWKQWSVEAEERERLRRVTEGTKSDYALSAMPAGLLGEIEAGLYSDADEESEFDESDRVHDSSDSSDNDDAASNTSNLESENESKTMKSSLDADHTIKLSLGKKFDNETSAKEQRKIKLRRRRRRKRRSELFRRKIMNSDVLSGNYEVICPYSIVGCETTCMRSELPAHLEICPMRAKSMDTIDEVTTMYNPLNYIVACPYRVAGCEYSCKRSDLPEHLLRCPARARDHFLDGQEDMSEYEIVCPNAVMGCAYTCLRSDIDKHLLSCEYGPQTRQDEEAERARNQMVAIQAAERERLRRVSDIEDDLSNKYIHDQTKQALLSALSVAVSSSGIRLGAPDPTSDSNSTEGVRSNKDGSDSLIGKRRVEWIVRAAEIELMRHKFEAIAMIEASPASSSGSVASAGSVSNPLSSNAIGHREVKGFDYSTPRETEMHPTHLQSEISSISSVNDEIEQGDSDPSKFVTPLSPRSDAYVPFSSISSVTDGTPHPYQDHMDIQTSKLYNSLQTEMEEYSKTCAKSCKEELRDAKGILRHIRKIAKVCFSSRVSVDVFGSYATGLAVPGLSDLDLVLTMKPTKPRESEKGMYGKKNIASDPESDRMQAALMCNILGRVLQRMNWIKNLKIIDTAQVPVIKFSTSGDEYPETEVDLTFALASHAGLKVVEFVKSSLIEFPHLKEMTLVLKTLLAKNSLTDPFTGGLSSYALVLMVLASLSYSRKKHAIEKETQASSLGLFMMDFLETYGRIFNPKRDAVVCNRDPNASCPVQLGSKRGLSGREHSILVVHDPITPGNNVGRSCFRFESVQKVFADALASLLSFLLRYEGSSNMSEAIDSNEKQTSSDSSSLLHILLCG